MIIYTHSTIKPLELLENQKKVIYNFERVKYILSTRQKLGFYLDSEIPAQEWALPGTSLYTSAVRRRFQS